MLCQVWLLALSLPQEGLPSDELAKSTLQAALKLRLSLIGSMLLSLRDSEQHCTDWALLLLQLLVSGAVDRQTDNRWGDRAISMSLTHR